jgi:hypothetical protein
MPPPIEYPLSLISLNKQNPYAEWLICHRQRRDQPTDCLCGKENIVDCIWIKNKYTGREEIIGSSCMNYFGEGTSPLCVDCEIYPSVTPTATLCSFCRGGIKTKPSFIVKCGKYKNQSYHDVLNDEKYSNWILSLPSFIDKHLYEFLKKEKKYNIVK